MEQKFNISDRVRHIGSTEFDMVVKDFGVKWPGNMKKTADKEKNFEYPVCSFYNVHTKKWEERMFHQDELELSPSKDKDSTTFK